EIPLVVRCRSKDRFEAPSDFDIGLQSRSLIARFADSVLAARLPEKLRTALSDLASWISTEGAGNAAERPATATVLGRPAQHILRAFEGAVARAANIVFATTNSPELERLI